MKAKKLYFMDCHLAGRKYHDADEVWTELKVGTSLKLVRDMDNRYDINAVAVVYDNGDEYLLGYIPKEKNTTIAQLLEMGWTDIFSCTISKINEEAHSENQIQLTIRMKKNESNK